MVNHQHLAVLAALWIAAGCAEQPPATSGSGKATPDVADKPGSADTQNATDLPNSTADVTAAVNTFCGACHAVPQPSSFPRDAWYHEVQRGYQFYFDSGRTDLVIPVQSGIVEWFQARAPEKLPEADQQATESPVAFERREWNPAVSTGSGAAVGTPATPAVFSSPPGVSFVATADETQRTLWFSDMLRGRICEINPAGETLFELRAVVANPAAVRIVDLDQDGRNDLLAADLGSPLPADHDRGQVLWISDYSSGSKPLIVLEGIGRVADVRPGDFDGDGDPDLVVAEFGWHTTGGLHVVWNEGRHPGSRILWRPQRLDSRPGGIHVPVLDLDGDGRLDFIALISQEHESVEVFLNRPTGFEKLLLFAAPDPSWGSSGIEPVDFDGDGDTDILYTAGDTFDSRIIKPFHGIWLLVNQGDLKFQPKHLAAMPGVHRALPGDLDQDGDLDVVACAILPTQAIHGTNPDQLQATIWLEQKADGSFLRHLIQSGPPQHPAMTLADLNGDGKLDILTAVMSETGGNSTASLEAFLNCGR
ncbi:MAG: FG-GAP-like repeat-containing protein [Planctomycetaceae bacterium]